jgi:hypothetical protein
LSCPTGLWKNSNSEKRFGRDYQQRFIELEEALSLHMQEQIEDDQSSK